LYTERLRALKHFAANGGIDLWGRLWENGLGEMEAEFGDAIHDRDAGAGSPRYSHACR